MVSGATPPVEIPGYRIVAEIGRGGVWSPAVLGGPINMGDTLRTSRPGRMRVVFADGSVIVVAPGSEIVVNQHVYSPAESSATSAFDLLKGKLRAVVSEYYGGDGSFEGQVVEDIGFDRV